MASYNKVILMGNLTKDPELKYTSSGIAIVNFSLAVNKKTGKGDDKKEIVSFFDVEAWDKKAEICSEYLTKGSPVLVVGELKQERWEGEDGKPHSRIKIIVNNFQFLPKSDGSGKGNSGSDGSKGGYQGGATQHHHGDNTPF